MIKIELIGHKFGRLTAIKQLPSRKNAIRYLCECECGNITNVSGANLRCGKVKSCGCLRTEIASIKAYRHGHSIRPEKTRSYRIWIGLKRRCFNPTNPRFPYYGGRGITVCDRWKNSFKNFLADMGECPPGLTIERINNNGNYEPSNCRWATHLEQCNNRRTNVFMLDDDKKLTMAEFARKYSIPYGIVKRLYTEKKLSVKEILQLQTLPR